MLVLSNCYKIHEYMLSPNYKVDPGKEFDIYYPKHRTVCSIPYRVRIPQTSFILNYYYPRIIPLLSTNNCACIKGRGIGLAHKIFKDVLRRSSRYHYCLILDIKKYFPSIDHDKLFEKMSIYLKDKWAKDFYILNVNSNGRIVGLDLGSEINQLSATTFLDMFDKTFSAHLFIRYADDMRFFGTWSECNVVKDIVSDLLASYGLKVNQNKTYVQKVSKPIPFLGYTFLLHKTGRITAKRDKSKIKQEKRRLRKMKQIRVPFDRVKEHYNSVRSGLLVGTRSTITKMDHFFNYLFKEEISNAFYYQEA